MNNFNANDLLLYMFNEAASDKMLQIEKEMNSNLSLQNEFLSFQQTMLDIEHFNLVPNDRIIDNIMAKFSHQQDVHTV